MIMVTVLSRLLIIKSKPKGPMDYSTEVKTLFSTKNYKKKKELKNLF